MARIRKGDMVEILTGNDRGKRGRVLRVIPDKNRVVVQGVNLRWKHMRKSQQSPQGGRLRKEMPIQASNVMVFDEGEAARTRIGFAVVDGKKTRIGRRTGKPLGIAPAGEKAKKKKTARGAKKAAEEQEES